MTYYWEILDRMDTGYGQLVQFCNADRRSLLQDDRRLRSGKEAYPIDVPRPGEVLVMRRVLTRDPSEATHLRLGIWSPKPPAHCPNLLTSAMGGQTVFIPLVRSTPRPTEPTPEAPVR